MVPRRLAATVLLALVPSLALGVGTLPWPSAIPAPPLVPARPDPDALGLLHQGLAVAEGLSGAPAPAAEARLRLESVLALDWSVPADPVRDPWRRLALLSGLDAPVAVAQPRTLEVELVDLLTRAGASSSDPKALPDLPPDLRDGLALVLAGVNAAAAARERAFASLTPDQRALLERPDGTVPQAYADSIRLDELARGAAVLLANVQAALPLMQGAGPWTVPVAADACGVTGAAFQLDPTCHVIVGSAEANEYRRTPAVLIDLGGDNMFLDHTAAVPGLVDPVGVSVALAVGVSGRDTYDAQAVGGPAQGAGTLGIGLLLDAGGDDVYRAATFSQGAGNAGAGILIDLAGSDSYAGGGFAQGAGSLGFGLLTDSDIGASANVFAGGSVVQGAGSFGGTGLLVASGVSTGTDRFQALDLAQAAASTGSTGVLWSPGSRSGNHTAQDRSQAYAESGGLGLLIDPGLTADAYQARDYAQGAGLVGGSAALLDTSVASDQYRGRDHVQAFALLGGAGFLLDAAGTDVYRAGSYAQGSGLDNGLAALVDAGAAGAGLETFVASERGQGHGANSGWGLLVDAGGDSAYEVGVSINGCCLQGAGHLVGLGLLLDFDGNDAYLSLDSAQGSFYAGSPYDRLSPPSVPQPGEANRGGVGALLDVFGDRDTYQAGRFSQGYSTLKGTGILVDFSGTANVFQASDEAQGCGNGEGRGLFYALGLGNSITNHANEGLWICDGGSGFGLDVGTLYHCWLEDDC
jgi:hypothetical protein